MADRPCLDIKHNIYNVSESSRHPFSGTVFVFRAERADRIELIIWEGTGLCLFAKRLEEGAFRRPKIEDGNMRLTPVQRSALIERFDWTRVRDAEVRAPTAVLQRPGANLRRGSRGSARGDRGYLLKFDDAPDLRDLQREAPLHPDR
jgi:transposase